jgi:glycosyltransferase involved in cell wall biosynthesis
MYDVQPLVSVGIPTYNRPSGLRSIIEDICKQTYTNIEVIISDNCSPNPEVKAILEDYSNKDSRIKFFIQSENKGAAFNFRFVLAKASGEFFMWVADDDGLKSEFIERCVNLHKLNEKAILCSTACEVHDFWKNTTYVYQNFLTLNLPTFERIKITLQKVIEANFIFYSLYKSHVLKEIGFSSYFGSDLIFIAKLSQFGGFISDNSYVGFKYNLGPQGISSNFEAYKDESNLKRKLSRHFFVTISLVKGISEILNFKNVNFFQRIYLGLYFFKLFVGNYRWSFVKKEFSSFLQSFIVKVKSKIGVQ